MSEKERAPEPTDAQLLATADSHGYEADATTDAKMAKLLRAVYFQGLAAAQPAAPEQFPELPPHAALSQHGLKLFDGMQMQQFYLRGFDACRAAQPAAHSDAPEWIPVSQFPGRRLLVVYSTRDDRDDEAELVDQYLGCWAVMPRPEVTQEYWDRWCVSHEVTHWLPLPLSPTASPKADEPETGSAQQALTDVDAAFGDWWRYKFRGTSEYLSLAPPELARLAFGFGWHTALDKD